MFLFKHEFIYVRQGGVLRTCFSNKRQSEVYLDQFNAILCLHRLNTEYFGCFDLDIELQKYVISKLMIFTYFQS